MAKAKFEIKNPLNADVTRPLYAGVGVTDLAVEVVRDAVADMQKRLNDVQKDLAGFDYEPKALREQATKVVGERVDALTKDAKARRAAIEKAVAELQADARALPGKVQSLLSENVETAGDTYGDLVKRGESLVGRIRRQESTKATVKSAATTATKAKTTKTQATKSAKATTKKATATAKKRSAAPKSSAKATATAATKTAENAAQAVADAAEKIGD
jgi:ElaB/YqjD/DUF883 family membrane-anchored ribosome-binding protein